MNPNTLVVVSGYSGDAQQVVDFLPWYLHHECPVLVLSPGDSPIPHIPGTERAEVGLRGYTGPHTLERQRLSMLNLLGRPFTHFLWHDADSICLSPQIPGYLYQNGGLWSNEVVDTNKAPSKLPKVALQPPYFMDRVALQGLANGGIKPAMSFFAGPDLTDADRIPVPTGCIDHWMLQVAHSGGVEHRSFFDGASFETKTDHGLETMIGLVRDHGRVMIHSVKDRARMNRLQLARDQHLARLA